MRKVDKDKSIAFGKAAKTLNFDKIVLLSLERRAKEEGTTASFLANTILRSVIMSDADFYAEMARYHNMEMQNYLFMKKQSLDVQEVRRL